MIWFNGGPGCSSLYGLLYENGPCVVGDESDELFENEFTWAKKFNMLYLEHPAGIGYSYSKDRPGFNDITQSYDTLKALNLFYEKFPEFKN